MNTNDINFTGELFVIKNFINKKDIVFDVGANIGSWSLAVLNKNHKIHLHVFEPVPETFEKLKANLPIRNKIKTINKAVGKNNVSPDIFYYYRHDPALSTLYRRLIAEDKYKIPSPIKILIETITIDSYCKENDIKKINFLKIDVEGAELDVIEGANEMLSLNKIDHIQFEYGGAYLDADISLQQVCRYMSAFNYTLFKIHPTGVTPIDKFYPNMETFAYLNFLFVNNEFLQK